MIAGQLIASTGSACARQAFVTTLGSVKIKSRRAKRTLAALVDSLDAVLVAALPTVYLAVAYAVAACVPQMVFAWIIHIAASLLWEALAACSLAAIIVDRLIVTNSIASVLQVFVHTLARAL